MKRHINFCSKKECWLYFFLVFIFGVIIGYMWHFVVFKRYEANEKNCYKYLVDNKYLWNIAQEQVLDELFQNAKNKGDVFVYYDEEGKGYKIRRIK